MSTWRWSSHLQVHPNSVYSYMRNCRILWFAGAIVLLFLIFQQSVAAYAQTTSEHMLYLPMIAAAKSRATSLQTSDDLILLALQHGEIDSETALVYRVFAAFADKRLPAQYRSVPTVQIDSTALDDLQSRFPALTPHTQEIMAPFLIPPIFSGS